MLPAKGLSSSKLQKGTMVLYPEGSTIQQEEGHIILSLWLTNAR